MKLLCGILKQNETLTDLSMFLYAQDEEACKDIASLLALNRTLTSLRIERFGVDNPVLLSLGMPQCTITRLCLRRAGIGSDRMFLIYDLLLRNTLLSLDIGENYLGAMDQRDVPMKKHTQNAQLICEALRRRFTPMEHLAVDGCFEENGVLVFARALQENIKLQSLDISDNVVDYRTPLALGAAMLINKHLQRLAMRNAPMHAVDVIVFINGLLLNTTLHELDVRGNPGFLVSGSNSHLMTRLAAGRLKLQSSVDNKQIMRQLSDPKVSPPSNPAVVSTKRLRIE